jgi:hypothetical protein
MANDKHDDKPEHGGNPAIEVLYLKTNDEEKFHSSWNDSVQHVWDAAYAELGEAKQEGDTFECQDGTKLGPFLGLTLEQMRAQNICVNRKFQIRGPAGGA